MNSNLKLLSAGLLVAALAGCGGSSSDDEMPPPPTPEEACAAMGQGYAIDSDGECKSLDDARQEGADDAAQETKDAAATKAAIALYNLLGTGTTGVPAVVNTAAPATIPAADKSSQSTNLQGVTFAAVVADATRGVDAASDAALVGYFTLTAAEITNLKADVFGGISQKSHAGNAPSGNRNDFVTAGTFQGVSGMLRCAGATPANCTSKDGSASGGTWYFKPNNAMDRITGPKIEWGWWLTRENGDINMVHRFVPAAGTGLVASTGMEGLGSGTASYEGDATGQYAVVGDSGAFEATASLTATFGAAAIPLSGSIHTFTGADGESRDWMVELKEIADSGSTGDGAYTVGATVWGGNEMTSAWNATMFNGTADNAPNIIVGDFSAARQGGRMTGVFGAEIQE